MPEHINEKSVFSLLEVTRSIQKTIAQRYTSSFWVKAEMNKLNYYRQSGHSYPELVEKKDDRIIAQIKANIWRDDFDRINAEFQRILKEPLKDGIKILFLANISFDPLYGLAMRILDIDPSFTLGDLEKEKQDSIRRLQEEGIYSRNKSLTLPLLPQRIAIISVEISKGYIDFMRVLEGNPWNYQFFHFLFPSILQGEKAIEGIMRQLKQIRKLISHFDVVAIIRGGGADIGLSCYNNYELAREIALFPIPVITGIGHATNETVSELVSFTNAITPTKLAEFLLQTFHNFSVPLQEAEDLIAERSKRMIREAAAGFAAELKLFRSVAGNMLLKKRSALEAHTRTVIQQSVFRFKTERELQLRLKELLIKGGTDLYRKSAAELLDLGLNIRKSVSIEFGSLQLNLRQTGSAIWQGARYSMLLRKENLSKLQAAINGHSASFIKNRQKEQENLEKTIFNLDPANVLKRGYSITYSQGKVLKSAADLKKGDIVQTRVYEGQVTSVVQSTNNKPEV